MKAVFRADSSLQIGSGHVMRCITLADELRRRGAEVLFVCREHQGNLNGLLEQGGFQVARLSAPEKPFFSRPEDAGHAPWLGVSWKEDAEDTLRAMDGLSPEWLIVDHYALDRRWEERLRPHVGKIMVIDDLADRAHDCEMLLDQNPYIGMETKYSKLLPLNSKMLLGPRFALLRAEFREVRRNLRKRNSLRKIMIFFGGSDPTHETLKALEAIRSLQRPDIAVDVVIGSGNTRRKEIESLCQELPKTRFYCQINYMAELLNTADLAIGAGGATTLERCALGVPSLVVAVALNQEQLCRDLASKGIISYLGPSIYVTSARIKESILEIEKDKERLLYMQEKSKEIVDCDGIHRVSDLILSDS